MSSVQRLRDLPTRDRGGGIRTTFVVAPGRSASFAYAVGEEPVG